MNVVYLAEIMKRAALPEEGRTALLSLADKLSASTVALIDKGVAEYEENTFFNYKEYLEKLEEDKWGTHLLFAFLLTEHTHTLYLQKGWSEQLFDNMLLDLVAKARECLAYYGVWGTFTAPWFGRWFTLERVALERLQFELYPVKRSFTHKGIEFTPETKAINVHIPSIGPLDMEKCHRDYIRAAEIFRDAFDKQVFFMCHSWLLNPDHPEFLPPTSRLLAFQKEYDILEFDEDKEGKFLWRLFGVPYDGDPNHLTERNSLERAYKQRVLAGGRIGAGFGIMIK